MEEQISLQTNSYCCNICNKKYTRKISLDKHKILCEFKLKTKNEIKVETEEAADIPNHLQLVKIVQELSLKLYKMEEKMEEMQQWVDKKKKQLNILENLNALPEKPIHTFKQWLTNSITIMQTDVENLMVNSLNYTFNKIFEREINTETNYNYPIKSFIEKQSMIYIYDLDEEKGETKWKQMNSNDFILLLKTMQMNLISALSKWKTDNKGQFDESDKIAELFNKAIIKLMNLSFTQDAMYSKIRSGLYNYLKINYSV